MSATVSVLVTDLRREPTPAAPGYERDFLQETQLLYGEKVTIVEEAGTWFRVEAANQPQRSKDNVWKGYSGWIKATHVSKSPYLSNTVIQTQWAPIYQASSCESRIITHLPFGACCKVEEAGNGWLQVFLLDGKRGFLEKAGSLSLFQKVDYFVGTPYLWGGCSPYQPHHEMSNTGVDCSSLVHLLYRSAGITIPRDARDQLSMAHPVERLSPGDLVFRADPQTPHKIDHVMIYEKEDTLIEACLEAGTVRRISGVEKLGAPLKEITHNSILRNHVVFFGRISPG